MTDIELTTVTVKPTIIREIRQDVYPCTTSLPRDDKEPLTFRIPPIHDAFLDCANIYLKLQAQIVKVANDVALTADESKTVGLINYLGAAMWKNCEVFLQNQPVYDAHNAYPFINYLSTVLYASKEAKRTYLTSAFYYEDGAGLFDSLNFEAAGPNKAAVTRASLIDRSQIFETYTRIFADQFNQQRLLVNNVEVMIKLTPHNIQFYLMQAGVKGAKDTDPKVDLDVKLKLLHAELYVNRVFLREEELKKQEAKLAREPFLYPYVEMKPYIFIHSNTSTIFDQTVIEGVLPERVYLIMLQESKYNGNFKMNTFEFEHHHVASIQWTSAGRSIPASQPLAMDFRNKKYNRAYQWLFENVHNDKLELTRDQFVGGYAVFCADLTLGLDANAEHYINKQNIGSLRLQLTFAQLPRETLVLLIIGEFERVMSINSRREIAILDPNAIKTE